MANTDPDNTSPAARPEGDVVPLRQATRAWFSISLQTFGGPAGQIAVMQRHLVDERRWIGQHRFLHALNYCMLLPGPEAQQLAIYVGWLLNGLRGGLIAGTLFVLPGLLALLVLSAVYVGFGDTTAVTADSPTFPPSICRNQQNRPSRTRPGRRARCLPATGCCDDLLPAAGSARQLESGAWSSSATAHHRDAVGDLGRVTGSGASLPACRAGTVVRKSSYSSSGTRW